uniref:Uncharacterized protein n=1 Tax=Mycena chlorophos TaxID=658473 RepID=A0ABQ0KZZ6_MYCCL|nr:predicted protein [Mycena chlorophos]
MANLRQTFPPQGLTPPTPAPPQHNPVSPRWKHIKAPRIRQATHHLVFSLTLPTLTLKMLTTTNPYRPTVRRARSSSLTIVTAKAQAVVQTMKTVTRPRAASDPGPSRFQRSLCPPRKSCLKSTPTTFEPYLPADFEDHLVEEPELDSSLPCTEESSILSADSTSDEDEKSSRFSSIATFVVRVKLALRRRSRHAPAHNHAHPSPSRRLLGLPLTMPQFSQPGYCTEPVVAVVDGEYEDDDVCAAAGGVRFVLPDDSHLKQGMDAAVLPVEAEDDEDEDEELSWAAMQ